MIETGIFSAGPRALTFIVTTGLLVIGLVILMAGRTLPAKSCRAELWRARGFFLILLALVGPALCDLFGWAPGAAGFYIAAGWWLCRRSSPGWATVSLGLGLILGISLGLQGVAIGRLRFTDVLWSGLLIFGLAHVLYGHVLRLPLLDRRVPASAAPIRPPGLPAMCVLLVRISNQRLRAWISSTTTPS